MKKNFKPDFEEFLKVLNKEKPERPVLFEFYMNKDIYDKYGNSSKVETFFALGYDYATVSVFDQDIFPRHKGEALDSISQNSWLFDSRADFESFPWKDPEAQMYKEQINKLQKELPTKGKFIGHLPQSVLGGLVASFGYENLCMLCYDDPELVADAAAAIGSRLLKHVEIMSSFDCVGAMILNDDWGFSAQTRLAPDQMRQYIVPWYKKMAEAAHSFGKPVILHSCGNMWSLINDICDDCKIDAKHSYEDKILPVEEAYKKYSSRIAIMGGIDVDFLARKSPSEIQARANALLDLTEAKGSYALGSGNSIPQYIPEENYLAMLSAAWNRR
jgi:uroporphyrinogen decarboxylase